MRNKRRMNKGGDAPFRRGEVVIEDFPGGKEVGEGSVFAFIEMSFLKEDDMGLF